MVEAQEEDLDGLRLQCFVGLNSYGSLEAQREVEAEVPFLVDLLQYYLFSLRKQLQPAGPRCMIL